MSDIEKLKARLRSAQADVVRHLRERTTKAESERDRLRDALEEVRARLLASDRELDNLRAALSSTPDETRGGLCDNCSTHAMDLAPVEGEGLVCGYCRRGMASRISGQRGCGERDDLAGGATAALAVTACRHQDAFLQYIEGSTPIYVCAHCGKTTVAPTPAPMGDA